MISCGFSILWNSLPGDMHFDGIESWGFSFPGIRPHRIHSSYNLIPHLMDFDGIVSLGDFQFHGCLTLGVMDFMEFVPTDQSFYTISSITSQFLTECKSWGFTISWTFGLGGNGFHGICPYRTIISSNPIPDDREFCANRSLWIVIFIKSTWIGWLAVADIHRSLFFLCFLFNHFVTKSYVSEHVRSCIFAFSFTDIKEHSQGT
jgi:hypothetical protein